MQKITVLFQFQNVTAAQYDGVWNDIREAGLSNPDGLLHHVGAPDGNGWFVCDVWESVEKFQRFGEHLLPFMAKNGIPEIAPKIMPVAYEFDRHEVLETA